MPVNIRLRRAGSDQKKNEPDCLVDINSWFDHFNLSATKIATDKIDTFVCIAL